MFTNEVELRDNRYFVRIPFYATIDEVPENFDNAKALMHKVHDSLQRKGLVDDYHGVFKQQLQDGIIEEIDLSEPQKRVFIPHHPVIKSESTTKIRPVFNCSYKQGTSPSLNEACYPGVNLLNDMKSLLQRFRTNDHVLMADIEKAFLQIFLKSEEDKNRFCFLWKTQTGIIAYRFRTILFGLNCSPFILNHVLQLHLQQYANSEAASIIRKSLYVDNFLYTSSDLDLLANVYQESIEVLRDGGFNLRSWQSNHPALVSMMEKDGTKYQHEAETEKTLGYAYNPKLDTLSLAEVKLENRTNITKRQLLSDVSKTFDPLSLAVPVTIRGRLLMKQVWEEGTDWDEPVSTGVLSKWNMLRPDLLALQDLKFPRKTVDLETTDPITLNVFCDGSATCYGVACYLTQSGSSKLVYSHSKLAPAKKSIPQIELMAVLQALDCVSSITTSLNLTPEQVIIWCDAQVVLEWLHSGTKVKSKFTINRLKTASKKRAELETELNCQVGYKYVNTRDNVADMLTRGLSFTELNNNMDTWLTGPTWLSDPSVWPKNELQCISESTKQAMQVNTQITEPMETVEAVIDPEKYSSLQKLYNVTSRVYQFINKLRHRKADSQKQAESYWLSYMQKSAFQEELQYLQSNNNKAKSTPKYVNDLNLFIDNAGLLRCKGRLSRVNYYSYSTLNPILVAKHHPLTVLLVRDQHQKSKHLGIGTTLTALRERGFWIPAGRQVVKRIIKECVTCQKFNNLAFSYPKLTDLPKERVRFVQPFQDTAIDYTGHVYVKDEDGQMKKMYIVVYTCLAMRAIHLDVVPDLTVKSFLQSFSRFCSVYRVPLSLYTDNASYFVAAQKVMKNFFLSEEFKDHIQQLNITHKTIPAYASWVGGVYERQVKTVKQCLYKTVGRAKLNYFELTTHLAAVQDCVNNRPITYVSSEIDEVEPLTPNKLLKPHTNPRLRLVEDIDGDDPLWTPTQNENHEQLNKTLQKQEQILQNYKKMWYSQYLLSLRETSRDVFQTAWEDKIAVGDVVLIDTRDKPRVYWNMGRVTQVLHGVDGKVRQVVLKTPSGQSRYSTKLLYPLEVQATHSGTVSNITDTASPVANGATAPSTRPRRQAALKQAQRMKDLVRAGAV